MHKLFQLKKWLTLEDAARYLSLAFNEPVTEADILRLGLDEHLTLSVNFVNGTRARPGALVPIEDAEVAYFPTKPFSRPPVRIRAARITKLDAPEGARVREAFREAGIDDDEMPETVMQSEERDWPASAAEKMDSVRISPICLVQEMAAGVLSGQIDPTVDPMVMGEVLKGIADGSLNKIPVVMGINIDDKRILELAKKVETISGIWDLPMIGAERLDVEHAYQQLTGGPEVTLMHLNGVFVRSEDGQLAQLQESYDSREMRGILQDIQRRLEAQGLQPQQKREYPPDHPNRHFPRGGLPPDAVLVVRTSALTDFIERMRTESESAPPKIERCRTSKKPTTVCMRKLAKLLLSGQSPSAPVILVKPFAIDGESSRALGQSRPRGPTNLGHKAA